MVHLIFPFQLEDCLFYSLITQSHRIPALSGHMASTSIFTQALPHSFSSMHWMKIPSTPYCTEGFLDPIASAAPLDSVLTRILLYFLPKALIHI